MTPHPPHLPAKSCSIPLHQQMERLPWILLAVITAILGSFITALIVVMSFSPRVVPQQSTLSVLMQGGKDAPAEIDAGLLRQTRQQLLTVYSKNEQINTQFFSDTARVGQAVLLSSDGWTVMHYPEYSAGIEKTWLFVDSQGIVFEPEQVVVDRRSQLLYINVTGEGFRVTSFPNWNNVSETDNIWGISFEDWEYGVIGEQVMTGGAPYVISRLAYAHEPDVDGRRIVLSERGELLGFTTDSNQMIPSWYVTSQLANILDSAAVQYTGFTYTGEMISSVLENDVVRPLDGFYVYISPTNISSTTVGVGDVITRIQGRQVRGHDVARQVLEAPEEVKLELYRNGSFIEIAVEKSILIR